MNPIILALLLLTGCATLEDRAVTAAVSDGVTTGAALALGAVELNPLGAPFAIAVKVPMLLYANSLPEEERAAMYSVWGPVWGGVSANNVCVLVAILTGGIAAPICIATGVAFGVQQWVVGEPEREFYTRCAEYREQSGEKFRCVYSLAMK